MKISRQQLVDLIPGLLEVKAQVQAEHDAHVAIHLAAPDTDPGNPMEEKQQKLSAMLRQLNESFTFLRGAVDTLDQLTRHELRVQEWMDAVNTLGDPK